MYVKMCMAKLQRCFACCCVICKDGAAMGQVLNVLPTSLLYFYKCSISHFCCHG